jgi:hypothetical protein
MNPGFPAAQDEGQASTSIGASSEDLLRFDCMQSFPSSPAPLHPEQGSLSFLWEDLLPDDNNTIQDAVEGLDLTPFNIFNPVADGCDLFAAPLPERTEPDVIEMNGIGMSMASVKRLYVFSLTASSGNTQQCPDQGAIVPALGQLDPFEGQRSKLLEQICSAVKCDHEQINWISS